MTPMRMDDVFKEALGRTYAATRQAMPAVPKVPTTPVAPALPAVEDLWKNLTMRQLVALRDTVGPRKTAEFIVEMRRRERG